MAIKIMPFWDHTKIHKKQTNKHTNIQTYKQTYIQTYKHTNIQTNIHGWLPKCWFLNSAILPQLLAARLIIIMWAYHTFSLANFKIKCVLRGRRSSAGSFFSPRCSHWCYCCHYCYLHCCPCSPHLVHIVPIFILDSLLGWFFCWLA